MNKRFIVVVLLFSIFACNNPKAVGIIKAFQAHNVSAYELKQKIKDKENILILDIRQPSQYRDGHITGSINVPYYELKTFVRDHNVQTVTIILVSQYQVEAKQAMNELIHMGYTDVMALLDGFRSWEGEIEN